MFAAMRISCSLLVAAVLLLAPMTDAVTLPPVSGTAPGAAPSSVKRQRNYGPLGNLIANAIDKMFPKSASVSPRPAAAAFEEARLQSLTTPAAVTGLDDSQVRRAQYNYGLLGNMIAGLMDGAFVQRNTATPIAKPSASGALPAAVTSHPSVVDQNRVRPMQRSYGPLGNVIAGLMGEAGGRVAAPTPMAQSSQPVMPVSSPAEDVAPRQQARRPSPGLNALKGVRKFVQMLGSSFVPDPAFERAASALKQRDQGIGIDSATGEGGFVTAGELDLLLSRVKVDAASA